MSSTNIVIPDRPPGDPDRYDPQTIRNELIKISDKETGVLYFINNYIMIYSNDEGGYIPMKLWDTETKGWDNQVTYVQKLNRHNRVIAGKARQCGLSLCTIAFFLYHALITPPESILMLSRAETEAEELMRKIRSMYKRLPKWLQAKEQVVVTKNDWELSNGSIVRAFSTTRGDSLVCSRALVDECDLIALAQITTLRQVLLRVEPTVGKKGSLVLLSKFDKSRPNSTFKNMFRQALKDPEFPYVPVFVPWYVHPDRDALWRQQKVAESLAVNGTLDMLNENWPDDPLTAMQGLSTDKRLPFEWVRQCFTEEKPLTMDQIRNLYDPKEIEKHSGVFSIPSIEIFRLPKPGEEYVIAVDTCEGLLSSDMASLHVVRRSNREECALISAKVEPSTLAYYAHIVSHMYNRAKILPERNHHGHAFILWLRDNSDAVILQGMDANNNNSLSVQKRYGWATTSVSKSTGYSKLADALRDQKCIIHSSETFRQLCAIRESSLEAPKGEHDDSAVTFMLSICAIDILLNKSFSLEFI